MSNLVNTVDILGDETLSTRIIERSIEEFVDTNVVEIGTGAFSYCSKLEKLIVPYATKVNDLVCYECGSLKEANMESVTELGQNAFYNCGNLTKVNAPAVNNVKTRTFFMCSKLTEVNFPLAKNIQSYAFQSCKVLTKIIFQSVGTVMDYAFFGSAELLEADFPVATTIYASAFGSCTKLTAMILRNTSMCTLRNASAFTSTPIASGAGYIYVPAALVDSYKAATNWSTYAAQFRALEDYTVDGTTTGELDQTKIAA